MCTMNACAVKSIITIIETRVNLASLKPPRIKLTKTPEIKISRKLIDATPNTGARDERKLSI